jgi:MerR family transcriptional regulator, light-induced transcriptional regulator
MNAVPDLRTSLDRALRSYDRGRAVSLALAALDDGTTSIPDLYDVLSDVLIELGAAWQSGTTEVWQEHLVTGVVRSIVEACVLRVEDAAPEERRRTVVLAAPDDEYHDLGLRMLTDRFTLAGWRTHLLGANVPAAEVSAAARELDADAVALSASTHFHRVRLRSYASALAAAQPDLTIWVGGPAFALDHEGWPDEMLLDRHAIPPADEVR